MYMKFCTKRDKNGNRKYINLSTTKKEYTRDYACEWYSEEYITVSGRDFHKILDMLKAEEYVEVT